MGKSKGNSISGSDYLNDPLLHEDRAPSRMLGELDEEIELNSMNIAPKLLELEANVLSLLTFSWMNKLMALGRSKPLEQKDLPEIHPKDSSDTIYTRFEKQWAKETALVDLMDGHIHESDIKSEGMKPSLTRALKNCFIGELIASGSMQILYVCATFMGPMLLNRVIVYLKNGTVSEKKEETWVGYMWVACMFIFALIQSFSMHQYFHRSLRLGMHLKTAVVTEIYRKTLRLAPGGFRPLPEKKKKKQSKDSSSEGRVVTNEDVEDEREGAKSTGEIVNLMSVDAQRLQDLMMYFHSLWSAPIQVTVALALLWLQVGVAVFAGIAVIFVSLPITGVVAFFMRQIQKKLMKVKDERIKVTTETLSSMRVIKLYAWETSFGQKN